jgi:exopolysaccharide biosynthesis polyprenyl glycosylphosphotransferase
MATSEYIQKGFARKTAGSSQRVRNWSSRLQPRSRFVSSSTVTALLMMANDAITIVFAFGAALVVRAIALETADRFAHNFIDTPISPLYLAWFILAYLLNAKHSGLYTSIPLASAAHEIRLVVQSSLNAGLLLCGLLYMADDLSISRTLVMLLFASTVSSLTIRRMVWRRSRFRQFERGLETRNLVILGTNHLSGALGQHIEEDYRLGYRLRGYIAVPECGTSHEVPESKVLGGIERLRQLARMHFIDEVVIAEPCPPERAIRLVKEARELDLDIRAISGFYGELTANTQTEYLGVFPVVSLHRSDPRTIALMLKRAADIVLSLLAIIWVAPVMIAVAIAIRVEGDGTIFYVSERIGKRGRVFPCFKFRTMVKDAEQMKKGIAALNERDGILFKVTNDPRITKVGKFLRKYSLDELPQFFNVLRGEMSMVGPRPPIASEVEKYELEHFRRLEVLPGLTGLWQVQARQDSSFAKYIALDTAYVESWSFWLDLKIMLSTAGVIFRGTGT